MLKKRNRRLGVVSRSSYFPADKRTHLELLSFAETAHITLIVFRIVDFVLDLCHVAIILGAQPRVNIGLKLLLEVIGETARHRELDD